VRTQKTFFYKKQECEKMPKVIVYSAQACPYCHIAKDFLKENKVEFTAKDVGSDPDAGREMVSKSGQSGVPVIDIDGKIIVGFNEAAIKQALGL